MSFRRPRAHCAKTASVGPSRAGSRVLGRWRPFFRRHFSGHPLRASVRDETPTAGGARREPGVHSCAAAGAPQPARTPGTLRAQGRGDCIRPPSCAPVHAPPNSNVRIPRSRARSAQQRPSFAYRLYETRESAVARPQSIDSGLTGGRRRSWRRSRIPSSSTCRSSGASLFRCVRSPSSARPYPC